MPSTVRVISLSYKNTPLKLREQLTLSEAEVKAFYLNLKEILGIQEAFILSTCNRTEFYYLHENNQFNGILTLLSTSKGVSKEELLQYAVEHDAGDSSVRYFFEVSTGLHSKVVGDMQLPKQIKQAYQWCADAQMAGAFLHRLLHTAFFVNKRVHQETSFRDGAASTSYAAVETIESFLPLLKDPKILVLGLGEVGRDVVKTLIDKGYQNFTLCNRTLEKAEVLAKEINCKVLNFSGLETELNQFDIILSSIHTEQPLISTKHIRQDKIRYFIDLSLPKSIDPAVQQIHGTVLYNLDEIQSRANKALELRLEAIPEVNAIIDQTMAEFDDWNQQMMLSPTIQKLKVALDQIRKEEMARYMKNLTEAEAEKLDKITSSMMQKVMKLPVIQLKAACKRGEAETLIDVLNDLFDLERVNAK